MGFLASLVNALVAFLRAFQTTPVSTEMSTPPTSEPSSSAPAITTPETSSQIINATGAIVAIYTGEADATVATIAESLDVVRKERVKVNLRVDNKDVVYQFKTYDRQPNSNEYVLCDIQGIMSKTNIGKSAAYYISFPGTNGWTLGKHSLKIMLSDAQSNTVLDSRILELNVSMPGDSD